jgi:hypothetical protein
MTERAAFYFGCLDRAGHYFHASDRKWTLEPTELAPNIPWTIGLMDTGLLKNGRRPDVCDGKVFWTLGWGPKPILWHAFAWWDRSVDSRPNSNSGFYVRGFEAQQHHEAFAFAGEVFPQVVARQRHPLVLQT